MIQNLLKQVQIGLKQLQNKIEIVRIPKHITSKLSAVSIRSSDIDFEKCSNKSNPVHSDGCTNDTNSLSFQSTQRNDLKLNARKLFVYNSFTKSKQLATASGNQIYLTNNETDNNLQFAKAYICGPTTYDESHVGHAMTYIRFDLIRRILKRYCSVNLVSIINITDIDDKIITKALNEKKSCAEISNYYLSAFLKDLHSLNILPFNGYVPVTSQIDNIIQYVQTLEENGFAYFNEETGDIDLDTSKVDKELLNFKTDSNLPGRRSPADFSLWKKHKPNEPFWEYQSKITNQIIKGRPGWHIECSVISNSVLSNRIDFHFGGHDLLFPHHVNESRCCKAFNCVLENNKLADNNPGIEQENNRNLPLANLPIDKWSSSWIHFGSLTINQEKMSKSLNNFIQIKKFLRKYPKNTLRLLCIINPYRRDITYDEGNLTIASDLDKKLAHFYQMINNQKDELISRSKLKFKDNDDLNSLIKSFIEHNLEGIADDFDLNRGWSKLMELIELVNKDKTLFSIYDLIKVELVVSDYLTTLGLVLHGDSLSKSRNPNDQYIIKKLVDYRKEVRNLALDEKMNCGNKSSNIDLILKQTDNIRNSLIANHLVIQDSKFIPAKKK